MRGIKTFIILAVAALYFSVMTWCKGSDQFMLDAKFFLKSVGIKSMFLCRKWKSAL